MIDELVQRFGKESIALVKEVNENLQIYQVEINLSSPVKVLVTNGLSQNKMAVHEKHLDRAYAELYFCLPRYWDVNEVDNPNRVWPVEWLEKLVNYVTEKNGWFGPGHTVQCDKEFKPLSETMKQNHFIMVDPILLEKQLTPLMVGEKNVHFLGVLPIFGDEMDYKQGKGTLKFMKKLTQKGITEKLDDFRFNVLKSRFKLR